MGKPFQTVNSARPKRSAFDLSYSKIFTCDMGQMIPIMCDEMVPGDKFKVGNEIVIRMQPLVAPILHEINAYVHYFFVPTRLMWDGWEDFITGGVTGNDASTIPRWEEPANTLGSLWDFFGFPILVAPQGAYPLDFPRRAYNMVYNEYYRDQTLQAPIGLNNELILNRAWTKDYFTSALPWQQRGTAPSLPLTGSIPVYASHIGSVSGTDSAHISGALYITSLEDFEGQFQASLNNATTFNVADLRLAFQVQKWMERNARSGVRYTEFLKTHFGENPRDDRLQRPEYVGGSKSPVIISETLSTAETTVAPQGNMAGHGITASSQFCGSYHAKEFGYMIGILSVMPKPMYEQGINRQWLRRSKFDFFFPEFAQLSEQAIETAEIFACDTAFENQVIFGYQGAYDEMRYKPNMVCSQMRIGPSVAPVSNSFAYWHLARNFATAPELNESFIKCVPDKRIFAVPSEPGLIVSFGNLIKAIRPLPVSSEPGMIDHH
nr:MAG: major capsid protein [Microvirus sp.]